MLTLIAEPLCLPQVMDGVLFSSLALYGSAELSYNKQDSTGEFILLFSCLEIFCDKFSKFCPSYNVCFAWMLHSKWYL